MSNQRLVVEVAWTFGPFDGPPIGADWIALTRPDTGGTRAMSATWSIGRDDEFEHFPAGTATITLWNRDRHLDPDYAAGPHAAVLVPMVPVRIRSQNVDTGVYQDEFYGYVQGGWEQVLDQKGTLTCRIQLVDLLGVISGHRLVDVLDAEILALDPVGYWVLDREDAEQVADLSPNGHDATVSGSGGVTMGDRVLVAGHRPAARFDVDIDATSDRDTYGFLDVTRSPLIDSTSLSFSVVTAFQARTKGELNWRTLLIQGNGNVPGKGFQLVVKTDGKLHWRYLMGAASFTETDRTVVDGRPHLAFATRTAFYVDGVSQVGGSSLPLGGANGFAIGGGPGIQDVDHMDGWIGFVALYDINLSLGEILNISIGYLRLNGFRTDQQIGWALDQIGLTGVNYRNLDVGTVYMGPADTGDKDALEWIREVTATEGGCLYVDHRNGGKVRFTNRYSRTLATRSATSQATFTDDPSSTGIRYSPVGLDIAPNGLDGIVNQATVRWRDGEITISDAASIAAYGVRARTVDTAGTTPSHARSVGEWVVAQNKEPRSRVKGCVAADRTFGARNDDVHDLQLGDKVTFRVLPIGVGAPTTVTLFVDGIEHSADGVEWSTGFRFAQDQTFTPWLWGTGLWGTTALWG